ncbi:FKBP-type peptidyl-prolyl cis-trans isomerase [Budvicia diplopodorum]|uniref:FKBP-type peptidyl-prolyl cis-trans isomerase n=1 Tax=Budvicia diplopodorum TaxID=1119056 RepID=UPI001359D789|nr:FKBP-type peptidyl-prolyl cis-trans isomerase [Budvicia diplopodorum]
MSFFTKQLYAAGVVLFTLPVFSTFANQAVDNKEQNAPEAVQAEQPLKSSTEGNSAQQVNAPVAASTTDKLVTETATTSAVQAPAASADALQASPDAKNTLPVATPVSKELETSALAPVKFTLDSEEQKRAYASGVTLARYLQENMVQQQKLHITLDPQIVIAGIVDAFKKDIKMDDATIQKTMSAFDEQVNILNQAKFEQESQRELEIGRAYQAEFAQQDGVKKSRSGLLYLIITQGSGAAIKATDVVEIELVGTLVSGQTFEKTAQPITLKVSDVIPALRSGIQLAGRGGEIKLVVPSEQGYGPKGALPKIPPNATLIFEIRVLQANSSKSK